MKLRKLEASEVAFTVKVEEECCVPVRGNAMASGDDAADKRCEDEILDRLHRGDSFAWCSIVVYAEWKGYKGIDSLGCCMLSGESDVEPTIKDHGMRESALADLNTKIQCEAAILEELES